MLGSQPMARASCFPREDKVETAARYCQCDDQTLMPIPLGTGLGNASPVCPERRSFGRVALVRSCYPWAERSQIVRKGVGESQISMSCGLENLRQVLDCRSGRAGR